MLKNSSFCHAALNCSCDKIVFLYRTHLNASPYGATLIYNHGPKSNPQSYFSIDFSAFT